MLQIKNIKKEYRTGDLVQKALDDVSLNLRDNEFVAILGPSGSGKTTLLNIIGGLDRYDSGDLIINGTSTRKYKDRDWDSYRNHTIGFVFQSYNLIMHQTVLANVELALTISGISGAERRRRAEEALRKVGLGAQLHKKPNQMSGGQMQRVAIARALVNDPDIVLADEPTGALDSETSVQVMDLLKEVARDRLVVMVTHNPELAEEYATRIVTIQDGRIRNDTDPFRIAEKEAPPAVHRNLGHASMSFLTALSLSFNNLRTKKARTFLVSFAGSIGIIGIAMIMALSSGANRYIDAQEAEALAQYPLQIEKQGYDLTSLMMGSDTSGTAAEDTSSVSASPDGKIGVMNMADSLFSGVSNNDLVSLKKFLDSEESGVDKYVNAIEYNYGITPQIYRIEDSAAGSEGRQNSGTAEALKATAVPASSTTSPGNAGTPSAAKSTQKTAAAGASDTKEAKPTPAADGVEIYQLNPNKMFSSLATGRMDFSSMMSGTLGSDIFSSLPKSKPLYEDSYDVKAGHWPEKNNELVLVLSGNGTVSDVLLYQLGIKDEKILQDKIAAFTDNRSTPTPTPAPTPSLTLKPTSTSEPMSSSSLLPDSGSASSKSEGDQAGVLPEPTLKERSVSSESSSLIALSSSDNLSDGSADSDGVVVAASSPGEEFYTYDTFLGRTFKVVSGSDYYAYDREYKVWTDKSGNEEYLKKLVKKGRDLTIVGIVQPKKGSTVRSLQQGISYPYGLIEDTMKQAADSPVVRAQLADRDINVFTGKRFDEDAGDSFDMSKLFSVDEEAISKAFSVDTDALKGGSGDLTDGLNLGGMNLGGIDMSGIDFSNMDLGSMIDAGALQDALPSMSADEIGELLSGVRINATKQELTSLFETILTGFGDYAAKDPSTDLSKLNSAVRDYLWSPDAQETIREQIKKILEESNAEAVTTEDVSAMLMQILDSYRAWATQNGLDPADGNTLNRYLNDPSSGSSSVIANASSTITEKLRKVEITNEQLQNFSTALVNGYEEYAKEHGAPQPTKIGEAFLNYLNTEEAKRVMTNAASKMIDTGNLEQNLASVFSDTMSGVAGALSSQIGGALQSVMGSVAGELESVLTQAMTETMTKLGSSMGDMFRANPEAFADMISTNMDAGQIEELLSSMFSGEKNSLDKNLSKLGYADPEKPTSVYIYAKDFKAKNAVVKILDDYNKRMEKEGEDDKVITYTDVVATMMKSVTKIIDAISYVLIAFVAISLVVSSIMIGVITYISVLERRKEIGILRAIGASKHNVAQVFNAETFITGLLAGIIGITITEILIIPTNIIIRAATNVEDIRAVLPVGAAIGLIILSVILTMIAGLMPSGKAAKSDPVTALRTE
uniref:ABC transporter ATP-binding protein/permease n=1 Tax=Eubacterium cellulosolvens TaxID=29322 RepID=UPI000482B6D5|nr:ABC transporter ATP-binding protein/permease [[Eubacterium] cellulosolvens]